MNARPASRRKITTLALLLLVMVAAVGAAFAGYGAWRVRGVEAAVRQHLKDPESARFSDVVGSAGRGCGWVNAKNSMGGYAGARRFVVDGDRVEFDPGEADASDPKVRIEELEARLAFFEAYAQACPEQAKAEDL